MSMTPLHLAAVHRDADEVLRLLEAGDSPKELNQNKEAAIHCTLGLPVLHPDDAKEKAERVFRILWKAAPGTVVNADESGETVLFDMVLYNYIGLLKEFVKEYPDLVFKRNNHGQCAVHVGVLNGAYDALKVLFAIEGVPQLRGRKRRTIHHFAVESGCAEMAKLCFDSYPVGIDVGDSEGSTPLGLAARYNKPLAKYYRKLGAKRKYYGGTRCMSEPDDDGDDDDDSAKDRCSGAGGVSAVSSTEQSVPTQEFTIPQPVQESAVGNSKSNSKRGGSPKCAVS